MSATVRLQVNAQPVEVLAGASVAAAVAQATLQFRQSSSGQPRAPLCGMGVCFECRVRIDGVGQQRACLVDAREGMQVRTDG
ncbi:MULTISPECIES: 2Fe-2S iron-sulfur cluster-binding protein [Xanthomonas]|uniref:(2Fe-2S)-binding protein n=1 Tax=Xanthomonas cucurbitae TaxID=56453 RepID=A0ABY7Y876_9XANT|nr:2Fe-2S iron-sulfur cluster-binding protein [Xanthomonas cucurbitae]QHG87209.1 (2Fe-2S)-binding protein [Xanthomonas cucurbitae]WDM66192.1 (2Fe-2S)-binding protein [Xanthomonas cucurbitae]WDM70070.1 (2Fe-2S)-binding protein [Xanthomonas cucurbitae]WDM77135.1 (2Fe-2S)-binding protein [Xanthomonas cucurbitae]